MVELKNLNQANQQMYEMYLSPDIREVIGKLPKSFKQEMEEIRLRINKPLMVFGGNKDYFVSPEGQLLEKNHRGIMVTKKTIDLTIQFISNYSLYAVEEELKNGYITIPGGHRIGISGRIIHDGKSIKTMKDFNGLNIRIAREKIGASKDIIDYLYATGSFLNTLIISPPQCGKTTLLRDVIRYISNGNELKGIKGVKVGVVDERSELAACSMGVAQLDLGLRTDVLDACPKAQGIMILIRGMSPQVIATDEIGRDADGIAIHEALLAGIKLITTVHGNSIDDVRGKKNVGSLVEENVFERIIVLSNRLGVGTIEGIFDGKTYENFLSHPIKNKVVK